MKLGVVSHRSIAPVWETVPIGRAAIRALYAELALHPKPGLVSPLDSGSHDDMDMTTFMRSLFALRGYYRDIAAAGARGPTRSASAPLNGLTRKQAPPPRA